MVIKESKYKAEFITKFIPRYSDEEPAEERKEFIRKYTIENPAFKDVEFSDLFSGDLSFPSYPCSKFSDFRFSHFPATSPNIMDYFITPSGGILQSAREHGAFEIEAQNSTHSDWKNWTYGASLLQSTRTVVLYFKVGDKFYAAIDDTINPDDNIVMACSRLGLKMYEQDGKFLLYISHSVVKNALLRAEKSGRIVEVDDIRNDYERVNKFTRRLNKSISRVNEFIQANKLIIKSNDYQDCYHYIDTHNDIRQTERSSPNFELMLRTKAVDGKSEFGQNDLIKAIFLDDVAESYAQTILQRGYGKCHVIQPQPATLEKIGVNGNFVEVRTVNLSDKPSTFDGSPVVGISINPLGRGYARAVYGAREFSTEDKVVKLDEKVSALIREMCV
ncbi:MAG: hypothetical protein KAT43_03610 [Nanoarchaeota archaeon]|nr:hypothetical protein [Nanoarchaeota archaeon]